MAVTFLGLRQRVSSWSVEEDAASLDRNDSPSGTPRTQVQGAGNGEVLGLMKQAISIESSDFGRTDGVVSGTSQTDSEWTAVAGSALSYLNQIATIKPKAGVRADVAFRTFFEAVGLAPRDYKLEVDPSLSTRVFDVPAAFDNVWSQMRSWLSAYELDVRWVIDTMYLVPWREAKVYVQDLPSSWEVNMEEGSLTKQVDVAVYHRTKFQKALVYPLDTTAYPSSKFTFGTRGETSSLSADAMEVVTTDIELPAEVESVEQPTQVMAIPVVKGQHQVTPASYPSGIYMIIGKDNKAITPAQWKEMGGSVKLTLQPDHKTVTVQLTGMNYEPLAPYRIAESDGQKEYPGLYIMANNGSLVDVETVSFETGAKGTDNVTDIENPSIVDQSQAMRAAQFVADLGTGHYASASWHGPDPVRTGFRDRVRQSFGRLAGARFRLAGNWWRAQQVTFSEDGVQITADRDPQLRDYNTVYPRVRDLDPKGRTLRQLSDEGVL